jgi:hypothetical protein
MLLLQIVQMPIHLIVILPRLRGRETTLPHAQAFGKLVVRLWLTGLVGNDSFGKLR